MEKKELIEFIKYLRKKQNELNSKDRNYPHIYLSTIIEATDNSLINVNPFTVDLRSGQYFGKDVISGEYKQVKLW